MKYYIRITIAVFTTLILIIPGTVLAAKNTSSPDLPTVTKQPAPNIAATQQAQTTPQTDIATMEDIRDIKGPFSIPWPWWWAVYTGGGIILLLLVWGIWKLTKRSRALRIKLAFETAFEQLESARALMVPGKGEAFSIAVSDAIRVYIEERFDLGTTRRTTEEFMRQLTTENKNSLGNCRDELQRFLTHCDLAKFARYALSIEQMGAMHSSAWQFVEQTKPVQEKTPDSTGDTL